MKLRLQLAELLPAPPKPGTDVPHSDGAFGIAMEEMMATSASRKQPLLEAPLALPGRQSQTGAHPETAKPYQPIHIPVIETHGVNQASPLAGIVATTPQPEVQSAAPNDQNIPLPGAEVQNTCSKASPPLEPPPEQKKRAPFGPVLLIPSPVIRELRETSHDDGSIGDSPRPRHKTEPMVDEPTESANRQASGVLPIISQSLEFIIPVPALQPQGLAPQPDGSQPVSLKSSSKSIKSAAPGLDASRPASVPEGVFGFGDLTTTPLARFGKLAMPQAPATAAAGKDDKVPESIPSNGNAESSTKTHLTAQPFGKANTGVAVPSNHAFHPQSAFSADGADTNVKPTDSHATKEAERKTASEVKPEVRLNVSGYLTPPTPPVQPQAPPGVSSIVIPGAEKEIATHRADGSAAQVLQRMDLGSSSGVVPLRSDARRLDVGISSGALGWVEVRATTSASGRVDATLHVQNDASAQVLTSQSRDISDYAREHSVPLGQVSVGVGTGDSAQRQSHSTDTRDANGPRPRGTATRPLADTEQTHHAADAVSLISVRA